MNNRLNFSIPVAFGDVDQYLKMIQLSYLITIHHDLYVQIHQIHYQQFLVAGGLSGLRGTASSGPREVQLEIVFACQSGVIHDGMIQTQKCCHLQRVNAAAGREHVAVDDSAECARVPWRKQRVTFSSGFPTMTVPLSSACGVLRSSARSASFGDSLNLW